MFGWIDHIFHTVYNGVTDAVKAFVNLLIRGVYGFIHGIFRLQWDAWNDFWNGARDVWAGMRALSIAVYHRFIDLYRHWLPYLYSYAHWVLTLLGKAIDEAKKLLLAAINSLYHWALTTFDATRKWAVKEIWDPLFKSLTSAWHWLTHEGATIWHYFTHLPEFADLLFWHILASLEKYAWDAGKLLGRFFLSLFYHNVVRFATLMEDIVDAIL